MVSSIRFSGIASGMDTQSIVDSLMKAERIPLDKISQKKQVLEWKRDDYRNVNLMLNELDTFVFDGIFKKANLGKRTATTSNSELVTAVASASASNVSYKIDNVELATAARQQSVAGISGSSESKIDSTKSLWSQKDKFLQEQVNEQLNLSDGKREFTLSKAVTSNLTVTMGGTAVPVANQFPPQSGEVFIDHENGKIILGDGFTDGQLIDVSYKTSNFQWQKETINDPFTASEGQKEFTLSKKAFSSDSMKVKVGDVSYTVTTNEAELNSGGNKVLLDESTGKLKFGTAIEKGKSVEVSYQNNFIDFEVKTYNEAGKPQYKYIKIDGNTSLDNMLSTINSSNAGINMFYDSGTDKIVATRTATGDFNVKSDGNSGNEIEFLSVPRDPSGKILKDDKGNIIHDENREKKDSFFNNVLGLGQDIDGTGTDASFRINGLETKRKSNTFTLSGVTFTLNKNSIKDADGNSEASTVNIQTDTESITKTVTDFVNKYNEIIGKINGKLTEERYSSYSPLTDEEKEALSEDEVKKWEEKAKSGLLRRDSILSGALDKMRSTLYAEVSSTDGTLVNPNYNQLAEIGITTSKNYQDRGKLEIDTDKLKAAIEADPDAVYQLFMADGETSSEKGLARRLRESISSTVKSIEERAGNSFKTAHSYTMGKQLLDFEDQIDRYEDRLASAEDRYWNQFNAMEKAMQNLNSQSNMLMSYLGMGGTQQG